MHSRLTQIIEKRTGPTDPNPTYRTVTYDNVSPADLADGKKGGFKPLLAGEELVGSNYTEYETKALADHNTPNITELVRQDRKEQRENNQKIREKWVAEGRCGSCGIPLKKNERHNHA